MKRERHQNPLGERLRALRRQRGITLQALARDLGVHFTTVSAWERGRSEPDLALLGRLARQLGVNLSELVEGPQARRHLQLGVWNPGRWRDFKSRTEALQLARALLEIGPRAGLENQLPPSLAARADSPGLSELLSLCAGCQIEPVEAGGHPPDPALSSPRPAIAERLKALPEPLRAEVQALIQEWLDLFDQPAELGSFAGTGSPGRPARLGAPGVRGSKRAPRE